MWNGWWALNGCKSITDGEDNEAELSQLSENEAESSQVHDNTQHQITQVLTELPFFQT